MAKHGRLSVGLAMVAVLAALTLSACHPKERLAASGTVGQVWVTGLTPGASVQLLASETATTPLRTATADSRGTFIFYRVPPAAAYWVRSAGSPGYTTPTKVMAVTNATDVPSQSTYDSWVAPTYEATDEPVVSTLVPLGAKTTPSFGFIPVRDSTRIAVSAAAPPGTCTGSGSSISCVKRPTILWLTPYDITLREKRDQAEFLVDKGYVVVWAQIRGTWCSGGAYDTQSNLAGHDGYDLVEMLARQPWSTGSVGMYGFSGPGAAIVPVAALRPPHLAAVATGGYAEPYDIFYPGGMSPFGAIDINDRTTLRTPNADGTPPGGAMASVGRASWNLLTEQSQPRTSSNRPASWPGGDAGAICDRNQALHGFRTLALQDNGTPEPGGIDNAKIEAQRNRLAGDPALSALAPTTLRAQTEQIQVPVLASGSWQDQVGDLPGMFPAAPVVYSVGANGWHSMPAANDRLQGELERFFRLYVARMTSSWTGGVPVTLAADPAPAGLATERANAEAKPTAVAWELQQDYPSPANPNQVLVTRQTGYPNGAAPSGGMFEATAYLQGDGTATAVAPTPSDGAPGSSRSYVESSGARTRVGSFLPVMNWAATVPSGSVSFLSAPLPPGGLWQFGATSIDLWVRSSTTEANLQVTVSEVRSTGTEVLVQSGVRRASRRQLAASGSTANLPRYSNGAIEPLTPGTWTKVRVALPTVAHHFDAGSRSKVTISAPGGDTLFQGFDEDTSATVTIGTSSQHPSTVTARYLGAVPDNSAGVTNFPDLVTALESKRTGVACNPTASSTAAQIGGDNHWLLGQPCRTYVP